MLSPLLPGLCSSIDHCPGHAGEQCRDWALYTVPWAPGSAVRWRCWVSSINVWFFWPLPASRVAFYC